MKFPEGLPKFTPVVLTKHELREAMERDKEAFPFSTTCANCDCIWGAHLGTLCPATDPVQDFNEALMRMTALGQVPESAYQRQFRWRGTLFVPLLDTGEVGIAYFDLGIRYDLERKTDG